MRMSAIFPAWGRILRGYRPFLSVEITKQCPLRCPGCYAYDSKHMNNGHSIRELTEWHGDELVDRIIALVRESRPLHISIVGGEPLIRHRELSQLIPKLSRMGIEIQIVTSGVLPLPAEWARFTNLHVVVSVDGLSSEHNVRRAPATYDRILRNIAGHQVIIHCTVIAQFLKRAGYLREFAATWSHEKSVRKIWFSLFTPQIGDSLPERLTREERTIAIDRIVDLQSEYPKVYAPGVLLAGYRHPPASPSECIFAHVTRCLSPDLTTEVSPCQIGGRPECSECGCVAAAGFACIGKYKLGGLIPLSGLYWASRKIGRRRQPMRPESPVVNSIPTA